MVKTHKYKSFLNNMDFVFKNRDIRKHVVRQAIKFCKVSDKPSCIALRKECENFKISKLLPVKAPEFILVEKFIKFDQIEPDILKLIFENWSYANSELSASLKLFLEDLPKKQSDELKRHINKSNIDRLKQYTINFLKKYPYFDGNDLG